LETIRSCVQSSVPLLQQGRGALLISYPLLALCKAIWGALHRWNGLGSTDQGDTSSDTLGRVDTRMSCVPWKWLIFTLSHSLIAVYLRGWVIQSALTILIGVLSVFFEYCGERGKRLYKAHTPRLTQNKYLQTGEGDVSPKGSAKQEKTQKEEEPAENKYPDLAGGIDALLKDNDEIRKRIDSSLEEHENNTAMITRTLSQTTEQKQHPGPARSRQVPEPTEDQCEMIANLQKGLLQAERDKGLLLQKVGTLSVEVQYFLNVNQEQQGTIEQLEKEVQQLRRENTLSNLPQLREEVRRLLGENKDLREKNEGLRVLTCYMLGTTHTTQEVESDRTNHNTHWSYVESVCSS